MAQRQLAIALAAAVLAAGALASPSARAEVCVVADPTRTPLNVRDTPGGPVIGTLEDGVTVEVLEVAVDGRGQPWALVRPPGATQIYGWVFRRYLRC